MASRCSNSVRQNNGELERCKLTAVDKQGVCQFHQVLDDLKQGKTVAAVDKSKVKLSTLELFTLIAQGVQAKESCFEENEHMELMSANCAKEAAVVQVEVTRLSDHIKRLESMLKTTAKPDQGGTKKTAANMASVQKGLGTGTSGGTSGGGGGVSKSLLLAACRIKRAELKEQVDWLTKANATQADQLTKANGVNTTTDSNKMAAARNLVAKLKGMETKLAECDVRTKAAQAKEESEVKRGTEYQGRSIEQAATIKKLELDLAEANERLIEQRAQLDETEIKLDSLQSESKTKKIEAHEAELEESRRACEERGVAEQSKYAGKEERQTSLENLVAKLQRELAEFKASAQEKSNTVANQEVTIENHVKRIVAQDTQIAELVNQLKETTKTVKKTSTSLENLKTQLLAANAATKKFQRQARNQEISIIHLQGEKEMVEKERDDVESSKKTLKIANTELYERLDKEAKAHEDDFNGRVNEKVDHIREGYRKKHAELEDVTAALQETIYKNQEEYAGSVAKLEECSKSFAKASREFKEELDACESLKPPS